MPERFVMHVVPKKPSGWAVKEQLVRKPLNTFDSKEDAVAWAMKEGQANPPSQVKIHKEDGVFEEERTCGNDPYPPEG